MSLLTPSVDNIGWIILLLMADEGEPSRRNAAEEFWQTETSDPESEIAEPTTTRPASPEDGSWFRRSAPRKKKNSTGSNASRPIRLPTFTFPPDETKTKILKVLERIHECHVNQDIIIPELVMCGKQSAGKSSVLEAITGLEFPKGDGEPCTRFVIE